MKRIRVKTPDNCLNIDGTRKLFIGFNNEDYVYLREELYARRKANSRMERLKVFIALHYEMDFVKTYDCIVRLAKRFKHYDPNKTQLKIMILTLGDYVVKDRFVKLLDEFELISKGYIKVLGDKNISFTGADGCDYSIHLEDESVAYKYGRVKITKSRLKIGNYGGYRIKEYVFKIEDGFGRIAEQTKALTRHILEFRYFMNNNPFSEEEYY